MPPSATRRLGLRRRGEEPQPQSDADTPDSISTPTRKKRRLNGSETAALPADDAPRARVAESVASNDSNATLPNGADADEPTDPVARQNLIIQSLRAPQYTPNAAIDYANDLQARRTKGTDIAAYAKIAARDWCFFVKKTILLIGRADSALRPNPPTIPQDAAALPHEEDMAARWGVDIDLGPERQISRVHAQIDFDTIDQTWYITVNSRNGLKLDDYSVSKGQRYPLHSGICIGIMGTQMLFLLANQEDQFHPMLWRQVKSDPDVDGESDKEGHGQFRSLPHAPPGAPTPKRDNYDPFPPSSHPRHKQSSQLYSGQLTSTPGRPFPGTPLAMHSSDKYKTSPMYTRGILLDSTEDIDYASEQNKDIKPPHSYAQMIGLAIMSSPEGALTLANIYQFIKDKYAYFRHTNAGWQNSIRHNLSLSKSFEKVARRTDEPGKGMKWKIVDSERDDFIKKQLLNPRKGGGPVRLDSSGPSSPAMNQQPSQATERLMGVMGHGDIFGKQEASKNRVKSPPRSTTPPLTSYPMANESYTPDRGPRPHQHSFGASFKHSPLTDAAKFATPAKKLFHDSTGALGGSYHNAGGRPGDEQPSSPNVDPAKPGMVGLRDHSADSPPRLYSDNGPHANGIARGLVTPLIAKHAPKLAPPSTSQIPSHYINFSSPAPFWKYVDLPSTPARQPLDLSPTKFKAEPDVEKEVEEDEEPTQPSSPPLIEDQGQPQDDQEDEEMEQEAEKDDDDTPESPSRTVSRPMSRSHLPVASTQRSRSNSNAHLSSFNAMGGGMVRGASLGSFEEADDEGGFDLAKGFQPIGSFHRSIAQARDGSIGQPTHASDARRSVSTNI